MSRLLAALVLSGLLAACSPSEGAGVRVVTTVYPVEFVARAIAGDRVEVVNVTPPGAEPHDVELGSDRVIDIVEADLIVYLGEDFQPAVEEALGDAEGRVVDALAVAGGALESGSGPDAHFWLDPTRLADVAEVIARELGEIAPEDADVYTSAAEDLRARLAGLHEKFESTLGSCASKNIVTAHEAFGYLAQRYGLTQTGIAGLDPEAEISPQRVADVVDFVRTNDVRTIFFETLLPADAAETIARETGTETSTLDPLESEPDEGDYFAAMERNLDNLREALECG